MRWPGHIEPGSVSSAMASTIDVLPTIAAITGAALPELPIDGVSILPVLEGEPDASPRNVFLYYYGGELRGVREGRWKRVYEHRTRSYVGVEPGTDGLPGPYASETVPPALYDLDSDPAETTDVADDYPDVVTRLDAIAEEARATLGDRLTDREGSEVRQPGRVTFDRPERLVHAAVGAGVELAQPPHPRYPGGGPSTLVDGLVGSRDFSDGRWLGFQGEALDAVVDLGESRRIAGIGLGCLQNQGPWIFFPATVEFWVSEDGESWELAGRRQSPATPDPAVRARTFTTTVQAEAVRYVRVVAEGVNPLPDWHPGAGNPAWVFADEIIVEG